MSRPAFVISPAASYTKSALPYEIIYAINTMRDCFGGIEVILEDDDTQMIVNSQTGVITSGVKLVIEGKKVFMPMTIAEDITVYGTAMAEDFVYTVIGPFQKHDLYKVIQEIRDEIK